MIRIIALAVVLILLGHPLMAAEVKNLTSGQSANKGFVQYDLMGKLGEKEADVTVFLEIGNERYPAERLSLSGDFGKKVKVGKGKRFQWDFLKDFPAGFDGEVTWDVEASGGAVSTPVGAKQGSSASPAVGGNSGEGSGRTDVSGRTQGSPLRDSVTGMEFIAVPAGCFNANGTQVCLDAFRIGKYEVTQWQYKRVMGSNPSHFSSCGDDCPVESVSWNDIQQFLEKLNGQTSRMYRLPTEAEWHYACTSGGQNEEYCGGSNINAVAWYNDYSGSQTHRVGQKQPNGLGIYDMSGNVLEWVSDWDGYNYPTGNRNPTGAASGDRKVLRGGSWASLPESVRASIRLGIKPVNRGNNYGFRLAVSED